MSDSERQRILNVMLGMVPDGASIAYVDIPDDPSKGVTVTYSLNGVWVKIGRSLTDLLEENGNAEERGL